MNSNLESLKSFADPELLKILGLGSSTLLTVIGGWLALRWRVARRQARQEREVDQSLVQAAQQFAEQPSAREFFVALQLQRLIRRLTGVTPAPAEFETFLRFYLREHTSLPDLKAAWRHRHYNATGELTFRLNHWDWFVLLLGRFYSFLCVVAGGLLGLLILLESPSTPLPQVLLRAALVVGVILCAVLPAYSNAAEEAALRLNRRQRRLSPPPPPDQGADQP